MKTYDQRMEEILKKAKRAKAFHRMWKASATVLTVLALVVGMSLLLPKLNGFLLFAGTQGPSVYNSQPSTITTPIIPTYTHPCPSTVSKHYKTYSVSVYTPEGAPAEGVTVYIYYHERDWWELVASGVTDANGQISFNLQESYHYFASLFTPSFVDGSPEDYCNFDVNGQIVLYTSAPPVEPTEPVQIPFQAECLFGPYVTPGTHLVIRTYEEMIAFGEGGYDESFFEENTLIYVTYQEDMTGYDYRVTGARKLENGDIRIDIDCLVPEIGSEILQWHTVRIELNTVIAADAQIDVETTYIRVEPTDPEKVYETYSVSVYTPEEAPAEGVTVYIYYHERDWWELVASGVTDTNGQISFNLQESYHYFASLSTPSFADGSPEDYCNFDVNGQIVLYTSEVTGETEEDDAVHYPKLIVTGQEITQGNCVSFHDDPHYALLPFTTVIKALGAELAWENESVLKIAFNGAKYILDFDAATLVKEGSSLNCMIPAPGSSVYYQIVGSEFMLDHITFRTVTMIMGIQIKIDVDYESQIVEIYY